MKRAGIPEWAWVLFAVLAILTLAAYLRRKLGGVRVGLGVVR